MPLHHTSRTSSPSNAGPRRILRTVAAPTWRDRLDVRLEGWRAQIAQRLLWAHARRTRAETLMLGSDWGGWTVVPSLLSNDSTVYSGGIGTDASFDTALIERFACQVHGFDPTPLGVAHAREIAREEPRFRFYPWGLWHEDTTVLFYAPANHATIPTRSSICRARPRSARSRLPSVG